MVRAFADQHDKEKRGRHMSPEEEGGGGTIVLAKLIG